MAAVAQELLFDRGASQQERRAVKAGLRVKQYRAALQQSQQTAAADLPPLDLTQSLPREIAACALIEDCLKSNTRIRYLRMLGSYATVLFFLRAALFVWIFIVARVFTWGEGSGAVTSAASVEMQTYLTELLVEDEFDANHNTFRDVKTQAEWWDWVNNIIGGLAYSKTRYFDERNYLVDMTVRTLRTKSNVDQYGMDFHASPGTDASSSDVTEDIDSSWSACYFIKQMKDLADYKAQGKWNMFKSFDCDYAETINGNTETIRGKYADYPPQGYVIRLTTNNATIFTEELALLSDNDLKGRKTPVSTIDVHTRAWILEFTIISPSGGHHRLADIDSGGWEVQDLVSRGWLMFEQSARRKVNTEYRLETAPLQPLSFVSMVKHSDTNQVGLIFSFSLVFGGVAMAIVEVLFWIELLRKRAYDPRFCGVFVSVLLCPFEVRDCVRRCRCGCGCDAAKLPISAQASTTTSPSALAAAAVSTTSPGGEGENIDLFENPSYKATKAPQQSGGADAGGAADGDAAAFPAGARDAEGDDDNDDGVATAAPTSAPASQWTRRHAYHLELRYLRSTITRDIAAHHHGHSFGGTILATPVLLVVMFVLIMIVNTMTSPGMAPEVDDDVYGAELYELNLEWGSTLSIYIEHYMSALRALTALNVMLWITALCHIVAMFPTFNIVSETFWAKITDILISVTYIFAITLAFMEYFRTEYGIFSEHFASFQYSLITFIKALMGDFNFEITASSQHDSTAPFIMGCYVVICVYFLLSIFVAILSDSFVLVSNQSHRASNLTDEEAKRRVSARAIDDVQRSIKTWSSVAMKKKGGSSDANSDITFGGKKRVDALASIFAKKHQQKQGFQVLRAFRRSMMDYNGGRGGEQSEGGMEGHPPTAEELALHIGDLHDSVTKGNAEVQRLHERLNDLMALFAQKKE